MRQRGPGGKGHSVSRAQRGLRPLQAPAVSSVTCHPSVPFCARGLPQVTPLSYPLGPCTACCDDRVQNKSGSLSLT